MSKLTDFSKIEFNPTYHTYTYQGRRLRNVTGLVGQLNPFDAEATAARIAARDNRAVEDVLADWEAKDKANRERGTQVHEAIADILGGVAPEADPFLSLNETLPEVEALKSLWQALAEIVEVLRIEWIVGDAKLGLGGTVDTLLRRGQTLHIWDWKTGDKFNTSSPYHSQCLPPFDDLDDCELVKYSLQTSLYRLILERNAAANGLELPMGDSYVVHLSRSGLYQIHRCLDLRERLLEWLQDA